MSPVARDLCLFPLSLFLSFSDRSIAISREIGDRRESGMNLILDESSLKLDRK